MSSYTCPADPRRRSGAADQPTSANDECFLAPFCWLFMTLYAVSRKSHGPRSAGARKRPHGVFAGCALPGHAWLTGAMLPSSVLPCVFHTRPLPRPWPLLNRTPQRSTSPLRSESVRKDTLFAQAAGPSSPVCWPAGELDRPAVVMQQQSFGQSAAPAAPCGPNLRAKAPPTPPARSPCCPSALRSWMPTTT